MRFFSVTRYSFVAMSVGLASTWVCADTDFGGGSLTVASSWSNGFPSSTNLGSIAVSGRIYDDVDGFDVVQTGGTIVSATGFPRMHVLRWTTWRLLGGTLERSKTGMRLGGFGFGPSSVHVDGGTLAVTASGEPLVISGYDSCVTVGDGLVTATGAFRVDSAWVHDDAPFLEFRLGGGTATFTGLDLGSFGYINFESGSAGQLTLTDGTIKDNLYAGVDTFYELWNVGRLRVDGANHGGFNAVFEVVASDMARTLRLKPSGGIAPRLTDVQRHDGFVRLAWNIETNRWIVERSHEVGDLASRPTVAGHSMGVSTNGVDVPVSGAGEFYRVLVGLQVLSGFADSNLIAAIKQIGLNTLGPASHVYDLDVAGLDEFFAPNAAVAQIDGVDQLAEVVLLDLRDNPLADASPISTMTQLEGLNLEGSSFSDTRLLSDLTNLLWVGLSGNQISELTGLSSLRSVNAFDLSQNLVTNLYSLASVSHATSLDLSGNGILDLSGIEAMGGLEYLDLHGNSVSDVAPLSNLKSLTWLDLSKNRISSAAPLATLTNLTWIGCSGNALTNITGLGSAERLEWLGLQDNAIEDLSGLGSLTNLTWLNLTSNAVSSIGELASLSNLRGLDLYSNNIDSLLGLEGLAGLHWLDVGENNISDLAPLLSNASMGGIGAGTMVYVGGNPLSPFAMTNQIPLLLNTYGVVVNPN